MNKRFSKLGRIPIILAGIFAISLPAIASADWTIRELGTLGGRNSYAAGINNSGQIVGSSNTASNAATHAFITGANGAGMKDLGTLGGSDSAAFDINDSGQVVGYSNTASNAATHAFITGANGAGMTDLGSNLNGSERRSAASGINNSGRVAGASRPDFEVDSYGNAFTTGNNGVGITELGTLGGTENVAFGINNSGQVAGWSDTANPNAGHAFITGSHGVGVTDLGTLGGTVSVAYDINDSGRVAGYSQTAGDAEDHAFITGANGVGMTDLGTLGGTDSVAYDINNSGQVVGISDDSGGGQVDAFLYSDGVMIDLSLLEPVVAAGWTNLEARAINDNGQIAGKGILHGTTQAFLLSPFPIPVVTEPETYAMLLAGLGLLGSAARWRRRGT